MGGEANLEKKYQGKATVLTATTETPRANSTTETPFLPAPLLALFGFDCLTSCGDRQPVEMQIFSVLEAVANFPRRVPTDHRVGFHIFRHYGTSRNHAALTDGDSAQDNRAESDPHIVTDGNLDIGSLPIVVGIPNLT